MPIIVIEFIWAIYLIHTMYIIQECEKICFIFFQYFPANMIELISYWCLYNEEMGFISKQNLKLGIPFGANEVQACITLTSVTFSCFLRDTIMPTARGFRLKMQLHFLC